jgi:transcriptional regulator with XRE-family HTH domain
MLDYAMLGARLAQIRTNRGKTVRDIADVLGVSEKAYGYYERGKRCISIDKLYSLADYYGVSIDLLVGRESYVKTIHQQALKAIQEALFYLQYYAKE